jgi:hypothetical protein
MHGLRYLGMLTEPLVERPNYLVNTAPEDPDVGSTSLSG